MAKKEPNLENTLFIAAPIMTSSEAEKEAIKKFYKTKGALTFTPELPPPTITDYKAFAFDILTKKFNITLGDWNEHIKGIFIEETTENHRARDIKVVSEMLSDYEEDVFKKAGIK